MATDIAHTRRLGDVLEVTHVYEFDDGPEYTQAVFKVAANPLTAEYWVAADGNIFFLDGIGGTCIASAESAMQGLGYSHIYGIWGYRNATKAQLDRWVKKWSARTREKKGLFA